MILPMQFIDKKIRVTNLTYLTFYSRITRNDEQDHKFDW